MTGPPPHRAPAAIAVLVLLALAALGVRWMTDDEDLAPSEGRTTAASIPADRAPSSPTDTAAPGGVEALGPGSEPTASTERHLDPSGDDDASGAPDDPWRSFRAAIPRLRAGDLLIVHEGTYEEQVRSSEPVSAGRIDAPVRIVGAPGEDPPVLRGLLWLHGADHWTVQGLHVTWSDSNEASNHMVKFSGGTGWRLLDSELSGARSYAALVVENDARDFIVAGNHIHDTEPTNDINQDHLIYVNNGPDGSGVIEDNLLVRSPNGRGVKIGPAALDEPGTAGIVVRYNTMVDNEGPSNVQLSGDSSDNVIHHNLFVGVSAGAYNVTTYGLDGGGNVIRDNWGWDSEGVVEPHRGLVDGGGNVFDDPELDADDGFRPRVEAAAAFGRFAGLGAT